ncbi:MAG: hypothetical protein H0V12_05550 [Chloroflexi bacterium]|nr:hypothetical protein [Chloroflexota bacterium]
MRIYEGSARQDFEEVLRSIGAFLDQRGMREIMLVEVPDGFVVQALIPSRETGAAWSDAVGHVQKETHNFLDDDIARFMDEAAARRNSGAPLPDFAAAGTYEKALRVIGRYLDQQQPRDIFFFEQDGAFVVRLLMPGRTGAHHVLAEFTRDEIETMVQQAPYWRGHRESGARQQTRSSGRVPRGG